MSALFLEYPTHPDPFTSLLHEFFYIQISVNHRMNSGESSATAKGERFYNCEFILYVEFLLGLQFS